MQVMKDYEDGERETDFIVRRKKMMDEDEMKRMFKCCFLKGLSKSSNESVE